MSIIRVITMEYDRDMFAVALVNSDEVEEAVAELEAAFPDFEVTVHVPSTREDILDMADHE